MEITGSVSAFGIEVIKIFTDQTLAGGSPLQLIEYSSTAARTWLYHPINR